MSSPIGETNSWGLLRDLAGKVNGKTEITDAELKEILEEADKNEDGLIDLQEYKDAFLTLEEYSNLEEEFLEAFEAIAQMDGEEETISETDITKAIEELEKIEQETETTQTSGGSSDYSGSYTPRNNDKTQTTDLTSKDLPALQSERSQVLSDIGSKRSEKEQAVAAANVDVASKQTAYDNATKAFQDLVKQKMETEQTTNEYAQEVVILEDQKTAVNEEISTQEGLISDTNSTISALRGDLSSLSEPPKTISYTNEETKETETKDNPAYQQYLDRKAALEQELAAAEAELANQEEKLESLKSDLKDTEDSLQAAMEKYIAIEEEAGTLTDAEVTAKENIDIAKEAYDEAYGQVDEIESTFDKEIDALQEQLIAYNDAITEKQLTLPEGFGVENGKITNGTYNLNQLDELPAGYKLEDGVIVDADGNQVGVASPEDEEGKQQLYLLEEVEPEPMSFAETYYIARYMFEEAIAGGEKPENGSWAYLPNISGYDVDEVMKLYNGFVSEYNANRDSEETPANDFLVEAEKTYAGNEETKIVYDAIVAFVEKAETKVEVKPDTFATYLEEKGVDASEASEAEMDAYLEEYMNNKYGECNVEEYYPPVTEEQLSQYLGEGGLAALEEVDEASVQSSINKILTDETLTPFEQMQLLNTIKAHSDEAKSYVDKYFTEDDSYFYSQLEDMTAEGSEYTPEDVLEFVRQYKGLDSTSTVLGSDGNLTAVLSLYENAENNEQLSELNSYLSASVVAGLVQENYTGEEAQEYTTMLFKASSTNMLTEDGKLSINPEDYKLTEEEATSLQQTYINGGGTTSEKVQRVLTDLNNGTIDKASAQYVVSSLMGGNPENIASVSGVNSKDTISQLFSLFGTKPYQAFGNGVEFADPIYVKDGDYQYGLIAPKNVDPNEELPVIVFMGGIGEYKNGALGSVGSVDTNGDGIVDATKYNAVGTVVSQWDLEDFNGYIIIPTLNDTDIPSWTCDEAKTYLKGVISSFQENGHSINSDKIFIGGHSVGGKGALYMAQHADDIFSKAFVMSGYSDYYAYDINEISIPMIGYNGKADSDYMNTTFQDKVGAENLVIVDTDHGAVPVNAFRRDADGDGKSDLIEWLLEDQALPENSDEY